MATLPNRRGLGVKRYADAPAGQVLGRADAGARVDEHVAVPEHPRRKYRDGDERAVAAAGVRDELGCRQFGGVEFLAADHAVENLPAGRKYDDVKVDTLGLDLARAQRLDAIVFAARVGQLEARHR